MGFPGLVLYGLGTTIGAGIYALTGVIAGQAGVYAPISFLTAAGLAGFTALSFCELCARMPRAGGEAVYVREGLRAPRLGTAVGLLVATAGTISAATVTTAFVGYLEEFVTLPPLLVLAAALVSVGALAAWGVGEAVVAAALMTLLEIGGIALVLGFAAVNGPGLPADAGSLLPGLEAATWAGIASGGLLAFYAFLGFEDMVNVAEEVRDVRRTLPRAILWTLGITTALYVATTLAAVIVVPPDELAASEAPLALVFERCGGSPRVLAGIALFAMLNGALVQLVKSSRVLYGLSSLGALPEGLGRIDPRSRTPLRATALCTLAAFGLAAGFRIELLALMTSSVTLVTFALANLALLVLKRRSPTPEGVIGVPLWVPAVGFGVSLGFVALEGARRLG